VRGCQSEAGTASRYENLLALQRGPQGIAHSGVEFPPV
jgi:hypothetical protein